VKVHRTHGADLKSVKQSQQWEVCLRKCRAVKGLAFRTRGLVAEGLHQMAQSGNAHETQEVRERWYSAQSSTRARLEKRFASLDVYGNRDGNDRSRSSSPGSDTSAAVLRGASSSDESALGEATRTMGCDTNVIIGRANQDFESVSSGTVSHLPPTKVDSLLSQLKERPESDLECAAKFGLYEAYSTEVEDMRTTMIKFHVESRAMLPEALATDMNHQICSIDNPAAMSIPEDTQEWFVFHMMKRAEQNNLSMSGKLESFEKKIKFLAASCQTECPVCLETFNETTHVAETLACCHKICTDCWTRWSTVMHGLKKHPFCPCCNHSQFLGTLSAEAGGGVGAMIDLSDSDVSGSERACLLFGCSGKKRETKLGKLEDGFKRDRSPGATVGFNSIEKAPPWEAPKSVPVPAAPFAAESGYIGQPQPTLQAQARGRGYTGEESASPALSASPAVVPPKVLGRKRPEDKEGESFLRPIRPAAECESAIGPDGVFIKL